MNPGKSTGSNEQYVIDELKREFFEEVKLLNGCLIEDIEFIGFINDDTIEVGRVHIGIFYDVRVSNKNVVVNETHKMTASWIDKTELPKLYERIETWSQLAIDRYIK